MNTYRVYINDINGSNYKKFNNRFRVVNPIEVTIQYYSKHTVNNVTKYMSSIPQLDLYFTGYSEDEVINGIKNKVHKMCYDYLQFNGYTKNDTMVKYRFILRSYILKVK